MSAVNNNSINDLVPLCRDLGQLDALAGDTALSAIDARIALIQSNVKYKPFLEGPAGKILDVIKKSLSDGQLANLSTRVDFFSKLLSQNMLTLKDPQMAVAFATKIKNTEMRDGMLYEALSKIPLGKPEDFKTAREILLTIHNAESKANAIGHFILSPLFKLYEGTSNPAYLNEIWSLGTLIPTDPPGTAAFKEQCLRWRENVFTKLAGYFSERPELRVDRLQGLVFEVIDEKTIKNPAQERAYSVDRLINAYHSQKAPAGVIASLMLSLPSLEDQYRDMKLLALRCERKGDKEGVETVTVLLNKVLHALIDKYIANRDFTSAVELFPRVLKKDRDHFEKQILDHAKQDILTSLSKGDVSQAEMASFSLSEYVPSDSMTKTWADTLQQINSEIEKATKDS